MVNSKIAVCEDCQKDAERLCEQLSRYCLEQGIPSYQINVYESGQAFLEHYVPGNYHLIFMDIYLENEDGMQVIRNLRKQDKDCPVVFFTRSTDHALEAYDVNAVHYLTKPLVYNKLVQALERCQKLHEKQARFILLHTEKTIRKVLLNEIIFVEVFNNTSVIHLGDETVSSRIPLKNLEEEICRAGGCSDFLRCHRSYLVNMNWVMAMQSNFFLMDTGTLIPISKYNRKQVIQLYEEFALRKMQDTAKTQEGVQ